MLNSYLYNALKKYTELRTSQETYTENCVHFAMLRNRGVEVEVEVAKDTIEFEEILTGYIVTLLITYL